MEVCNSPACQVFWLMLKELTPNATASHAKDVEFWAQHCQLAHQLWAFPRTYMAACRHLLMACWALSLLVAARRMSPGLLAGTLLPKLRVVLLVLTTLPEASETASDSREAVNLWLAALTTSAALGTADGSRGWDACRAQAASFMEC